MNLMLDESDNLIPPSSLVAGIERAGKLAGEISRIEAQLNGPVPDGLDAWRASTERALSRHQLEQRQLDAWIDAERDRLIERARALFRVLQEEDETYFTDKEMQTIKDLDAYLTTRKSDPDVCSCSCHTSSGRMHFVACCIPCPKCGRNINTSRQTHHREICNKTANNGESK